MSYLRGSGHVKIIVWEGLEQARREHLIRERWRINSSSPFEDVPGGSKASETIGRINIVMKVIGLTGMDCGEMKVFKCSILRWSQYTMNMVKNKMMKWIYRSKI